VCDRAPGPHTQKRNPAVKAAPPPGDVAGEGDVDAADGRPWDDEGQSPTPLSVGSSVNCNDSETVQLETNHDYLVRIHFPYGADLGTYVEWDLVLSW
jgi:hypothetical protein